MSSERKVKVKKTQKPPKAESAPLVITDKMKILCLHGYRQNADSFKSKTGSFRKFVNKYAEFVFISAPHMAPPIIAGDEEVKDVDPTGKDAQLSWWFNKEDGTFKGTNVCGPAFGFEKSLRLVEETWKEQGPFQGLLGFSQGASFVGLLCDLSCRGMTCIKPEFAILSSGFRSGSLAHKNYYENPITIPSLHIFGESDEIIPGEMSELLSSTFVEPEFLKHPGGHYFPATSQQKQDYIIYFQNRLQEYLEAKEIENANETNSFMLNGNSNGKNENSD